MCEPKPTIEHPGLCNLNFTGKPLDEVLVDNAVGGGEKGENVGDKVTLILVKSVLPVIEILGKVHLLGGPERRLRLLIHLPNLLNPLATSLSSSESNKYLVVLNWEEDKAALGLF